MRMLPLALAACLMPLSAQAPAIPAQARPGIAKDGLDSLRRLADQLQLTPDQRFRLRAILQAHAPTVRQAREAVRVSREALNQALRDPDATQARLQALRQRHKEDQLLLMNAMRSTLNEVLSILTPEQREKLKGMKGTPSPRQPGDDF
ncbi:MAG TPA: Spy/CpxP family protein refolding chaperone [Holophaga sp.]|nr:Spy/CpxP family protein refolding chaperone [Holophaga sp.]